MSTRYVTKAALVRDPLVALRRREGGVVGRKAAVLESVYGITKRPGIDHERRLAAQLGLEHAAVNLWFRNRRVSEKRAARRRLMLLGLGFLVILLATGMLLYIRTDAFAGWAKSYQKGRRSRAETSEKANRNSGGANAAGYHARRRTPRQRDFSDATGVQGGKPRT